MNAELDQVRQARGRLGKVRLRLLRPSVEALEAGAADLGAAVECMTRLEASLRSHDGQTHSALPVELELEGMRGELRVVRELLASIGTFHEGWARLLCQAETGAANYNSGGKVAVGDSSSTARLVIHG